jgi:ProP effector
MTDLPPRPEANHPSGALASSTPALETPVGAPVAETSLAAGGAPAPAQPAVVAPAQGTPLPPSRDTSSPPGQGRGRSGAKHRHAGRGARPDGAGAAQDAPHNASQNAPRAPRVIPPVLEQLADLYPGLFGEVFLPLKRGIFQDLLAAHPDVLDREALKAGLAVHTRSTRYLQSVAAGLKRHDLQGKAVEDMAPEHIHHALLEVFRRRQGRAGEDQRQRLRNRIVQAFEASGLSREAYDALVRGRDEAANAVLDEALAEAAARSAKDEALLRAFESGAQSVEVFAGMYGMDPRGAAQTLERARRRRAVTSG